MYKYETHLHTSEASACAISSGAEMAEAHKKAGYDGMIVTDHFFNGNTCINGHLPWETRVEEFCKGYENAKRRGDKIGLKVFLGWEYCYEMSEFLTYGLDKNWLLEHPEIMDMHIYNYMKLVRVSGGFTVHAHPFRQRAYIKKMTLLPELTGAVEVVNAGNHDPLFDSRAEWYAQSYNLPVTAGSDSHDAKALPGSGIVSTYEFFDIHDYIEAVKNRDVIASVAFRGRGLSGRR